MNTKRFHTNLLICAIALILVPISALADIDKKYFKQIADRVWATELPGFDTKADLSDSIFQGQNACFIARYVGLDVDYDNGINPRKQALFKNPDNNLTRGNLLRRNMVKINNAAAAEHFTEFSIDTDEKFDYNGVTMLNIREVFGARIHKPDGTVRDVDINEALTVKGGKRNKDVEYKIAIPGLEPGDILDYFFNVEYYLDEVSMPEVPVNILSKYPTKLFTLDVKVDPHLSVEYGAFNEAPKVTEFSRNDKGQNVLFLQLKDVFSLEESLPYFSQARQMPRYLIHVNNPTGALEYFPQGFRLGGMRIANTAFVLRDIGHAIVDTKANDKVLGEANSALKSWLKQNPDADESQIADAAWIAMRYAFIKSKEEMSPRQFAKTFYKLLEKQNSFTEARIGVANSRNKVDIFQISNFLDASYFVKVGDRYYIAPYEWTALGGEIPANYDSENSVIYNGRPDNQQLYTTVEYGTIPTSKPADNATKIVSTATISADNPDDIDVSMLITHKGASKTAHDEILNIMDLMKSYRDFLGIKSDKFNPKADPKELEEDARETAQDIIESRWDSKEAKLDSYSIVKTGLTPSEPELVLELKGSVPGLVSQAGNNLMINVGRLFGKQLHPTGETRKRDISIIRSFPSRDDNTVNFEIPEGYEIVPESLADLNRSVITAAGSFNSEAKATGNTVSIRCIERYNRSILPAQSWNDMLNVLDTAHDFSSASIILRPKK